MRDCIWFLAWVLYIVIQKRFIATNHIRNHLNMNKLTAIMIESDA